MATTPRKRRPIIEALEPRLLFSATADIAVFDHGDEDAVQLPQAAAALDLSQVYFQQDSAYADWAPAMQASPSTLIFVDTHVENYEALVRDIAASAAGENFTIIYIDAQEDGVARITETLSHYSNISSVHILSHSVAGVLQLGSQVLNADNISGFGSQLGAWQGALT